MAYALKYRIIVLAIICSCPLGQALNNSTLNPPLQEHKISFESAHESHLSSSDTQFWIVLGISIALTLFAGIMSGLTVGYLSIDTMVLELKQETGTKEEQEEADLIMTIVSQHHHLLVTLLLANAAAMEALPLYLDQLVPEVAAVIISVTAVLIFGEILPQAICTGPSQMTIAAKMAPFTKLLMNIEGFIAYPIACLLDKILGEHTKTRYQTSDLRALIELHSTNAIKELEDFSEEEKYGLDEGQTKMIQGALDLSKLQSK